MRILLLLIFMCSNYFSTCQNRDYKRYDKAVKLFKNNEFDKSKTILLKIIDKNKEWDKPFMLLSNIYLKEKDFYSSAKSLLNIYDIENPDDYKGIEKIGMDFYQNQLPQYLR